MDVPGSETIRKPADERRAAACLQACEGIPTELLERGIILRLIAACVHVAEPRIREVLEELVLYRLRRDERDVTRDPASTKPSRFFAVP